MKIIIQCAATKKPTRPGAGLRTVDNRCVRFVASPRLAQENDLVQDAHPDDHFDEHCTWRQHLVDYNATQAVTNSLGLLPAFQLYRHRVYAGLVDRFGVENVFILSAGWGLIGAGFLTPDYDITFSKAPNVSPQCRRTRAQPFADLCHLPDDGVPIAFLGGKDYLPLFYQLTHPLRATKKVFFNSATAPVLGHDFHTERYPTSQKTNWHYACAQELIVGSL